MPPGWTPSDWEPRHIDLLTLGVPVRLRCWGDDPDLVADHVRRAWSAALAPSAGREPSVVLDVVVTTDDDVRTAATDADAVAAGSIPLALHLISNRVTAAAV